jgi:hypothetical protein
MLNSLDHPLHGGRIEFSDMSMYLLEVIERASYSGRSFREAGKQIANFLTGRIRLVIAQSTLDFRNLLRREPHVRILQIEKLEQDLGGFPLLFVGEYSDTRDRVIKLLVHVIAPAFTV